MIGDQLRQMNKNMDKISPH